MTGRRGGGAIRMKAWWGVAAAALSLCLKIPILWSLEKEVSIVRLKKKKRGGRKE